MRQRTTAVGMADGIMRHGRWLPGLALSWNPASKTLLACYGRGRMPSRCRISWYTGTPSPASIVTAKPYLIS